MSIRYRRAASRTASWTAALALLLSSSGAWAQSTARLGHAEPAVRWELSGGVEIPALRLLYPNPSGTGGTVTSLLVAERWQTDAPVGLSLEGSWIERRWRLDDPPQYGATCALSANEKCARSSTASSHRYHDRLIVVGAALDLPIRVYGDLAIAPLLGAGLGGARGERTVAYYESGSVHEAGWPGGDGVGRALGKYWAAGLSARYRRVVAQWRVVGLLGARDAVPDYREYYPVTIGFRF